jgi:hypothetical protein
LFEKSTLLDRVIAPNDATAVAQLPADHLIRDTPAGNVDIATRSFCYVKTPEPEHGGVLLMPQSGRWNGDQRLRLAAYTGSPARLSIVGAG